MNTSERLGAWIVDLKLYEEFWESLKQRGYPSEIKSWALYQSLAIEFLKKHFERPEPISAPPLIDYDAKEVERLRKLSGTSSVAKGEHNVAESMAAFCEFTSRLREEAQDLARAAAQHEPPEKPTDPWGAPTDTRGYPDEGGRL